MSASIAGKPLDSRRDETAAVESVHPHTSCDFCHLPLPASLMRGRALSTDEPLYCCYGCNFAAQVTRSRGEAGTVNWMLTQLGLSVVLSMTVMMFSMYLYRQQFVGAADIAAAPISQNLSSMMRYFSLACATPVFLMLGMPILNAAIDNWRRGILSTDALVLAGVAAAFVYSYISTLRDHGATYYETGCVVLVFMTLGRWLEASGKLKASAAAASLESLFPDAVTLERSGQPIALAPREIQPGDVMIVPAGQRIAADGVIETGGAGIDEALITGESTPRVKEAGDFVRAGTLNIDGALRVRATDVGSASTLGRLIALLEQAKQSKSRYERLADRVSTAFIPMTAALAAVAAVLGLLRGGASEAILSALAVLLIACPCALGIATPTAIWAALGWAARHGILFRDGEALEALAGVRSICFDKTGTLTTGAPRLSGIHLRAPNENGEHTALAIASGLAFASTHALSRSVLAESNERSLRPLDVREVRSIPGRGLVGQLDGRCVAMGNAALMEERGMAMDDKMRTLMQQIVEQGHSLACIGWGGAVQAILEFDETLRTQAASALAKIEQLGLTVCVLTGDHAGRGRAMEQALNVRTIASLTPDQKVAEIVRLREARGAVAMVGDGLNDAPALVAADVGIALGCGADITRDAGRVCLLANDLNAVPEILSLARQTVRTIKVNLFWAFAYNIVGIGLAMTGRLNPIFAAVAMVLSSLLVVGNSLRLGRRAEGI